MAFTVTPVARIEPLNASLPSSLRDNSATSCGWDIFVGSVLCTKHASLLPLLLRELCCLLRMGYLCVGSVLCTKHAEWFLSTHTSDLYVFAFSSCKEGTHAVAFSPACVVFLFVPWFVVSCQPPAPSSPLAVHVLLRRRSSEKRRSE